MACTLYIDALQYTLWYITIVVLCTLWYSTALPVELCTLWYSMAFTVVLCTLVQYDIASEALYHLVQCTYSTTIQVVIWYNFRNS